MIRVGAFERVLPLSVELERFEVRVLGGGLAPALGCCNFAPEEAAESGIYESLPPGAFTAILAGNGGGTGIGLVEIYNVH